MKPFIRDSKILEQLKTRGYAVVDLMSKPGALNLLNHYLDDIPFVDSSGFHSTMFVENEVYRKRTDLFLKTQLNDPLNTHFSDFNILFANYIMKEANSESRVGIHQDWAFVNEEKDVSYNVWFPLVDTNLSNGCLWVLPGSHKLGSFPRYSPSDSTFDEKAVEEYSVPVQLSTGQAVIYHSGLIHYSSKNSSNKPRLAVGLVCVPNSAIPVHYFRNGDILEKFNVDSDFFSGHKVDCRPEGYSVESSGPVETIMLNQINRQEVESVVADYKTEVGKYYDEWHDRYEEVYGDIIQAVRPSSDQELLEYLTKSIGLKPGMRIVDAGAGTCGPAVHFAKSIGVQVDALTVSSKQAQASSNRIEKEQVTELVNCRLGDYHELDLIYEHGYYDAVVFLESLGHAQDPKKVLNAACKLLKPGGFVYIKDFYPRETDDSLLAERINKTIDNINRHYVYNVLDLHETITTLRKCGMAILHIGPLGFTDDTGVRIEFESKFNIEIFDGGEFAPAEWLEIKCAKVF
jgi:cyclopropane fatty-acyl-phospholipid synthase-like methyltransferase